MSNFAKEITAENSLIKSDMQKLNQEINDLFTKKCDKKDIDTSINKINKDIKNKADVNELDNLFKICQQVIDEKREDDHKSLNNRLNVFESDLTKTLEKKANLYEVTTLLNSKADTASTTLAINSKVKIIG